MMRAENPGVLYLLALVPVMIIIFYLYKRGLLKVRSKLGDAKLIDKLITGSSPGINLSKFILLILSFVSLVAALSKPYSYIEKRIELRQAQTEILFVTDVSKSMLATDMNPSRLAVARNFMANVVDRLNGERVSIVVFAGAANTYIPLTTDYQYVQSSIKAIANNMVSKPGTSLSGALKLSSLIINANAGDTKVLCVLSDGEAHENKFNRMSDSIRKAGINIFAFGLGTNGGTRMAVTDNSGKKITKKDSAGVPVITRLHEENLQRITGNNAARYYRLDDEKIGADLFLGELKKLRHNVPASVYIDKQYFQLFLLIALVLLFIESILKR